MLLISGNAREALTKTLAPMVGEHGACKQSVPRSGADCLPAPCEPVGREAPIVTKVTDFIYMENMIVTQ